MKVALSVSEDGYGRRSIAADLAFDEPARVLVFAWLNSEMWWAKSSAWQSQYRWCALYQHLAEGSRQIIITCGVILGKCIVPSGCEPEAAGDAEVDLLRPAVLFRRGGHGLGIIVVPQGAAKTMRNGIWQLKPSYMNPSLEPFERALICTRTGYVNDFVPNYCSDLQDNSTSGPAFAR